MPARRRRVSIRLWKPYRGSYFPSVRVAWQRAPTVRGRCIKRPSTPSGFGWAATVPGWLRSGSSHIRKISSSRTLYVIRSVLETDSRIHRRKGLIGALRKAVKVTPEFARKTANDYLIALRGEVPEANAKLPADFSLTEQCRTRISPADPVRKRCGSSLIQAAFLSICVRCFGWCLWQSR